MEDLKKSFRKRFIGYANMGEDDVIEFRGKKDMNRFLVNIEEFFRQREKKLLKEVEREVYKLTSKDPTIGDSDNKFKIGVQTGINEVLTKVLIKLKELSNE